MGVYSFNRESVIFLNGNNKIYKYIYFVIFLRKIDLVSFFYCIDKSVSLEKLNDVFVKLGRIKVKFLGFIFF